MGLPEAHHDARVLDGMTHERFEAIRECYWVAAWRDEHRPPFPWSWVFSPGWRPAQMPNPRMRWRHPTYEEARERQAMHERDPDAFAERVAQYAPEQRRRRLPLPELVVA